VYVMSEEVLRKKEKRSGEKEKIRCV